MALNYIKPTSTTGFLGITGDAYRDKLVRERLRIRASPRAVRDVPLQASVAEDIMACVVQSTTNVSR